MFDWPKRLFNDPNTLAIILSSGIVGLIAGGAQGVVQKRHGGWWGFLSAIMTGIAVAILVGLAIADWVPSETMRFAIVGASAVVSEDIFAGLKTIGRSLRADPFGFIFRVMDAMRGRPPAPRTPTGTTAPAPLETGDRS